MNTDPVLSLPRKSQLRGTREAKRVYQVTKSNQWRAALWLGLTAIFLFNTEAAWNAVQIGRDEHFELSKALLWSRGHELYAEVWSDQPPFLRFCWVCGSRGWSRVLKPLA